jgi:hypothetical protein
VEEQLRRGSNGPIALHLDGMPLPGTDTPTVGRQLEALLVTAGDEGRQF